MKKAIWEKELIETYRYKIKELIENEKDESFLYSYYYDLAILDALEEFLKDGKCFVQSDDFSKKTQQDISSLIQFEDFYEDVCNFESKRKYIHGFEVGGIEAFNISKKDILTFIFDFFHQFDDKYFQILDKIYKENKGNIIFSKHRSVTFSLSNNQGYFINIENNGSIEEYINGIHEFSHAIADYINLRYYADSNYPFFELLPLFVESNALDYLSKVMPCYEDDIYTYKKSVLLTLMNIAKKLIYQHTFYMEGYNKNKLFAILSTMVKNHESYHVARDAIDTSVTEKYIYLISYLVVIELLSCNDFELAKHRLFKIVKTNDLENYIVFLSDLGINLNEHSSEYIRRIRDNKKIIRY